MRTDAFSGETSKGALQKKSKAPMPAMLTQHCAPTPSYRDLYVFFALVWCICRSGFTMTRFSKLEI
jgi:hypothetical protein